MPYGLKILAKRNGRLYTILRILGGVKLVTHGNIMVMELLPRASTDFCCYSAYFTGKFYHGDALL